MRTMTQRLEDEETARRWQARVDRARGVAGEKALEMLHTTPTNESDPT